MQSWQRPLHALSQVDAVNVRYVRPTIARRVQPLQCWALLSEFGGRKGRIGKMGPLRCAPRYAQGRLFGAGG
jgi:hypothetical protein